MVLFKTILIVFFCWFQPIWANLKNCSDHDQGTPKLCLKGKGEYRRPRPVTVHIEIFLREVVNIDIEKNSITLRLGLSIYWKDPKIALTSMT